MRLIFPDAIQVIGAAYDVANHYGAQVRLVHAIPNSDFGLGVEATETFQKFLFETACAQAAALQREAKTQLPIDIQHGVVGRVVREAARTCQAQLIVIGHDRMQQLPGRLRTHVSAIIRESPCPVLSL